MQTRVYVSARENMIAVWENHEHSPIVVTELFYTTTNSQGRSANGKVIFRFVRIWSVIADDPHVRDGRIVSQVYARNSSCDTLLHRRTTVISVGGSEFAVVGSISAPIVSIEDDWSLEIHSFDDGELGAIPTRGTRRGGCRSVRGWTKVELLAIFGTCNATW